MGLREKVALAVVVAVTTQVICNHCFPEGLSNDLTNSLKRNNVRGFKTNKTIKKNLLINIAADKDFKGVRFPDVEYPSDFQVEDSYRLQNAYQKDFESKLRNSVSKTSHQIPNIKREAAQKCKYDKIGKSGDLDDEPALRPHRFTDSSCFPELEYPLSARDMWGPKYWNQLHDHMEKELSVEIVVPKSQNPLIKTKYSHSKYEKSPIKGIMKTLNTNNKLVTKTINNNSEISIYKNNDFIVPNNSFKTSTKTPSYDNIVPMVTDVPMEKITSATISDLWYSGVSFATTAPPFDKMTSPITPLLTTAPSDLTAENLGNYTLSVKSTTTPEIKFPGEFDALTRDWVLSTNDSIITWKSFPEDGDDWVIFVDSPKASPSTFRDDEFMNCNDINSNVPNKEEITLIPNSQVSDSPITNFVQSNSVNDVNNVASQEQMKLGELSKQTNNMSSTEVNNAGNDSIMALEDTNSHLQCNDDTWASYTEVPYEI